MNDLLPPYELLTPDQDTAIRHPLQKSLIMTGPPGSGKTVVALYRAQALTKKKKKIDILVYGKVLHSYIQESLGQLELNSEAVAKTFHSWFYRYIRRTFQCSPPELDKWVYDWDEIIQMHRDGIPKKFDQLIVDEGQDLPTDFFRFAPYMSDSITVFADMNQAIFQQTNTTLDQLRRALRRFDPKEITLKQNHRNTYQIAQLAEFFIVLDPDPDLPEVEMPKRHGPHPKLIRHSSVSEASGHIARYAGNMSDKRVGVFLKSQAQVRAWDKALNAVSGSTKVQRYIGGKKVTPPDFSVPGIYILTYKSAKGLEFDAVFIPELHSISDECKVQDIMELYVAFTRARDDLNLLYEGGVEPVIITSRVQHADEAPYEKISLDELKGNTVKKQELVVTGVSDRASGQVSIDLITDLLIEHLPDDAEKVGEKLYEHYDADMVNYKDLANFIRTAFPSSLATRVVTTILMKAKKAQNNEA